MYAEILSPTKMDSYLGCPEEYYHYIAGTTQRPSFSFRVGSCFHNGAEVYVKAKYQWDFDKAVDWSIEHIEAYPPAVRNEAIRIGNLWLDAKPLPPINRIVGCEQSFGPPGTDIRGKPIDAGVEFESGLKIRGIIDLLWKDGDTIVVGDYKTYRYAITDEDLAQKTQAMVYALAVKKITNRPVRVEFYMIRHPEQPVVWAPNEADYPGMESYLVSIQKRIKADKDHIATPSLNCRWCNFNYTCKAFEMWSAVEKDNTAIWHTMESGELIDLYNKWNRRELTAKAQAKELKELIVEIMSRDNIEAIKSSDGTRFKMDRRARRVWDEEAQVVMARNGGKIPPHLALEMSQHARTTYGKPFLRREGRR